MYTFSFIFITHAGVKRVVWSAFGFVTNVRKFFNSEWGEKGGSSTTCFNKKACNLVLISLSKSQTFFFCVLLLWIFKTHKWSSGKFCLVFIFFTNFYFRLCVYMFLSAAVGLCVGCSVKEQDCRRWTNYSRWQPVITLQ